jgi:hypothetical protein
VSSDIAVASPSRGVQEECLNALLFFYEPVKSQPGEATQRLNFVRAAATKIFIRLSQTPIAFIFKKELTW